VTGSSCKSDASPSWNLQFVRLLCAPIPRDDKTARDLDAKDIGTKFRHGQGSYSVAAREVENLEPFFDAEAVG
jgi:hypothetical protein